MKVRTIVALLVAAATSIAGAQPREERGGRVPYGERWRAHPPRHAGEWVRLATPTPTRFGTEWIVLGHDAGAFRTLRITALSGSVRLRSVSVDYSSGKTATFNVGQLLTLGRPSTRIDLGAPHYIERIAVTTARSPAGTYVVDGAWSLSPTGELVARR